MIALALMTRAVVTDLLTDYAKARGVVAGQVVVNRRTWEAFFGKIRAHESDLEAGVGEGAGPLVRRQEPESSRASTWDVTFLKVFEPGTLGYEHGAKIRVTARFDLRIIEELPDGFVGVGDRGGDILHSIHGSLPE